MPPPQRATPAPYVTTISTLYTAQEKADFQLLKPLLASKGIDVTLLGDTTNGSGDNTKIDIKYLPLDCEPVLDNNNKIVSFKPFKIIVNIQTTYGTQTVKTQKSAYGMGTRTTDIGDNTTIQFHESRHGQATLNFLKNTPRPIFTGKIGMTGAEFTKALEKFEQDFNDYREKEDAQNLKTVDCVGQKTIDQHRGTNQCSAISTPHP